MDSGDGSSLEQWPCYVTIILRWAMSIYLAISIYLSFLSLSLSQTHTDTHKLDQTFSRGSCTKLVNWIQVVSSIGLHWIGSLTWNGFDSASWGLDSGSVLLAILLMKARMKFIASWTIIIIELLLRQPASKQDAKINRDEE